MSIVTAIVSAVTAPFFNTVQAVFHDFVNKQISQTEANAKIETARMDMQAKLESEVTAQYESFQQTLRGSVILQRLTAAACVVELMVLVFYQLGVPAMRFIWAWDFPRPDVDINYAYVIVLGTLGIYSLARR